MRAMSEPRRVLLGALDPILRVGIARALVEGGAAVVDHTTEADALVAAPPRAGPTPWWSVPAPRG